MASREIRLDVLEVDSNTIMSFYSLDFKAVDTSNIVSYVDFCSESGLLDFLQNHINKNLVDYAFGVEAGLDSNARKNRSGKVMEAILNKYVSSACEHFQLEFKRSEERRVGKSVDS